MSQWDKIEWIEDKLNEFLKDKDIKLTESELQGLSGLLDINYKLALKKSNIKLLQKIFSTLI